MSNDTPIWSSGWLSCVKLTFWMSGRPSMTGLMELASSTRDSAMEKAAGRYGVADVIFASVVGVAGLSTTVVVGNVVRCPAKYDPPAITTTPAACASQRDPGRR